MKFLSLTVALLCLAGVCAGQEAKPAAPASPPAPPAEKPADQPQAQVIARADSRPDSGRVANDLYTSDYFGFTLALPAGWQVDDREALKKSVDDSYKKLYGGSAQSQPAQQAEQDAEARAFMLLSAEGRVAMEKVPSQIQIAAEQLPEESDVATGKDYLDAVGAQPALGGLDLKPLHPPAEVKLGGQPFWRQDFSASSTINGKTVNISYAEYVSIQKGYALVLTFWTDTPEDLAELVKYADSLKFVTPTEAPAPPK